VFPGVGHRYCANHFLRDLAKPVLEADSHAKVQMRRKVRGLRAVERRILDERGASRAPAGSTVAAAVEPTPLPEPVPTSPPAPPAAPVTQDPIRAEAQEVVLAYSSVIRGILNDDQGGPLNPPGLRMAKALGEVRASLQRCIEPEKGGLVSAS